MSSYLGANTVSVARNTVEVPIAAAVVAVRPYVGVINPVLNGRCAAILE